jgi:DNA-binding LytR/AlgR family response regulator
VTGLVASPQILSLAVAVLTFLVAGAFLLSLVPDQRGRVAVAAADGLAVVPEPGSNGPEQDPVVAERSEAETAPGRRTAGPLGGLGQPRTAPVSRLPVEGPDGTYFMDVADVRSIKADAHYTLIHDGARERMCPWSISEAEAMLDASVFLRVHRSHIVALAHIKLLRKEGDGAVVELDGEVPHLVPVSRPKVAELRARLGLSKRTPSPGDVAIGQKA